MQGISGRKAVDRSYQCLGCPDFIHSVSEYFINYSIQAIEGRIYSFKTPYRRVPMKYLLVDLHVCNESLAHPRQLSKQCRRAVFVRMRRSDEIHWDIGVNENHGARSGGSLSRSIVSMSAVGN